MVSCRRSGDGLMYRARITQVFSKRNEVKVSFVDTKRTSIESYQNIFEMPKNVEHMPALAFTIHLVRFLELLFASKCYYYMYFEICSNYSEQYSFAELHLQGNVYIFYHWSKKKSLSSDNPDFANNIFKSISTQIGVSKKPIFGSLNHLLPLLRSPLTVIEEKGLNLALRHPNGSTINQLTENIVQEFISGNQRGRIFFPKGAKDEFYFLFPTF